MDAPNPEYVEIITKDIQEQLKDEFKYTIISNLNHSYNIVVNNLSSSIEINASYKDNFELNIFSRKYSLIDLKEIKYLSILDSIDEIYEQIKLELSKNNSTIIENTNQINIIIPIINIKFKELSFILNKKTKTKTDKQMCLDLYKLVFKLQEQIKDKEKENNENIKLYHKEIDNLRQILVNLSENNNSLLEKINSLEKEVSNLKNENKELNEKIQSLEEKNENNIEQKINKLEDKYEEIDNPWTREKDPNIDAFDYILKYDDYFAQKNNAQHLDLIKSKHKFINNKIYKLKYNISYQYGRFRVGFGNYCKNSSRLMDKDSVGLTNEGLFVQGKNYKNLKIQIKSNTKEILFIINLKENPNNYELFIDGKSFGKYNFNLEIIYGIAAFENGAVEISTLRSSILM